MQPFNFQRLSCQPSFSYPDARAKERTRLGKEWGGGGGGGGRGEREKKTENILTYERSLYTYSEMSSLGAAKAKTAE